MKSEKRNGKEKRFRTAVIVACIFLPLAVGYLFYPVFSPEAAISRLMPECVRVFAAEVVGPALRGRAGARFFRNYGCDACWAFSLTSMVLAAAGSGRRNLRLLCAACVLFSAAVELLPLFGVIRGTFDPADLISETAAVLTAGFIFYFLEETR